MGRLAVIGVGYFSWSMPRTGWGWMVTADEVESWIIRNDESLLVVNKPAHLVCHPSKRGPWSSLIGACREYLGVERLHLVSRLDRETSGVVVLAKSQQLGSRLQSAIQDRAAKKLYVAILDGELNRPETVFEPVGPDRHSKFVARQWTVEDGKECITHFEPLQTTNRLTMVRVRPLTGRRHQIRVHAAWMGTPIVGDKLYGPDPGIMLRFISDGLTPDMLEVLRLDRHALHALAISFPEALPGEVFRAPIAPELLEFWNGLS